MGAVVTIRTKPGANIRGLRENIQRALQNATGEPVNVVVTVSEVMKTPEVPTKIEVALPTIQK